MKKLSMAIAICFVLAGSILQRGNPGPHDQISASSPQYYLVYADERNSRDAMDIAVKSGGVENGGNGVIKGVENGTDGGIENGGDDVLYRVMTIVLVIWLGLALYLFRIDRKIIKLEKDLNER